MNREIFEWENTLLVEFWYQETVQRSEMSYFLPPSGEREGRQREPWPVYKRNLRINGRAVVVLDECVSDSYYEEFYLLRRNVEACVIKVRDA